MSLILKATSGGGGGGERETVPAGNHPAVLVALVDLGTQHDEYQGTAKWSRQLVLVWELPTKKRKDGKSHVIDAKVTLSLSEKATLRKYAEAMTGLKITDGSEFDVSSLVGKACMINVLHKQSGDKTYANIAGVTGFPYELLPTPPAPTVTPFGYYLTDYQAGKPLPEWLPWQYSKALGKRVSPAEMLATCKEVAGDGSKPRQTAGAAAGDYADTPF